MRTGYYYKMWVSLTAAKICGEALWRVAIRNTTTCIFKFRITWYSQIGVRRPPFHAAVHYKTGDQNSKHTAVAGLGCLNLAWSVASNTSWSGLIWATWQHSDQWERYWQDFGRRKETSMYSRVLWGGSLSVGVSMLVCYSTESRQPLNTHN
jgi:hypothetical protein